MRFLDAIRINHQDMVSKKRLSYGFNGFRVPIVPKAPRSNRRRRPHKDLVKDSEPCAFDLLAAVAGKLLQESESSASSNVADGNVLGTCRDENVKPQFVDHKSLKSESLDHGSSAESAFVPENSIREPSLCVLGTKSVSEQTSALSTSGAIKKDDCDIKLGMTAVKDPVEDSVRLPLYSDPIPNAEPAKQWNSVKLGTRDDDDNFFGCSKSSARIKSHWLQPRFGHSRSRIRKMLSKYIRECELTSEATKSFHRYRKRIYTTERCQQAPFKKRKLSENASCDSISNLSENRIGVACVSATTRGLVKKAEDRHVRFSIKSFKVPELCIEVPDNASVGTLKRAVVKVVTNILGGGIQVGVVLQGKKLRDDNRTLLDAGICESSNLNTLGFMLEPTLSPTLPDKKLPSQDLPRFPVTQMVIDSGNPALADPSLDHSAELKSSSPTSTTDATDPDSKALITVDAEALAVIPVNQKSKRSEQSQQRRTRRPFSVAEVEALVEAVERLGTGRWRDIKIGAFEHADHRTYVDLKDKWKTLVHTASISPQQRRGEPVPQELLDRVLAAHSYWLQQHGKNPVEPMPLMLEGCNDLVKA